MKITKYIHSCLLVEGAGGKVLFDPGKFSFAERLVKPEQFSGLSAVVLTHGHPDHVEVAAMRKIVSANPSAVVLCNREVRDQLAQEEIAAEVFESGERTVGGFVVEAFDAPHAPILNSKLPQNTAYLLQKTFLNPGDSFAESLGRFKGVEWLALVTMAPWNTELQVAEFAKRLAPKHAVPVHDGYAKDFFLKQRYDNYEKYLLEQGCKFERLEKPGDSIELDSQ